MRLAGAVFFTWTLLAPAGPLAAAGASAQDSGTLAPEGRPGSGASVGAELRHDPETGMTYRRVRPPAGLRRGSLRVEAWVAVCGGALLLIGAAGALVARLWRRG